MACARVHPDRRPSRKYFGILPMAHSGGFWGDLIVRADGPAKRGEVVVAVPERDIAVLVTLHSRLGFPLGCGEIAACIEPAPDVVHAARAEGIHGSGGGPDVVADQKEAVKVGGPHIHA